MVIVPAWTDERSHEMMKESRFCKRHIVLEKSQHSYRAGGQHVALQQVFFSTLNPKPATPTPTPKISALIYAVGEAVSLRVSGSSHSVWPGQQYHDAGFIRCMLHARLESMPQARLESTLLTACGRANSTMTLASRRRYFSCRTAKAPKSGPSQRPV